MWKKDGAVMWNEVFDANDLDAMKHDGETKEYIKYLCAECERKYENR